MIWGLHNYIDANRFRTRGTRALLRAVKGDVWFTETGGLVVRRNGSTVEFPGSTRHAAKATSWVFRLAALSPRVKRVYFYHWSPAPTPRADLGFRACRPPRPAPPGLLDPAQVAAKARALALLAVAALAGCGGASEGGISGGGKVIGRTVTVYSLTSDPSGSNRDFVDAQKLALSDAGGRAGALAVNFASLELVADDDALQAQAVRRAIADAQIIAAIVDATPVTVPLFNAAGLLQVAPGGDREPGHRPQRSCLPASARWRRR